METLKELLTIEKVREAAGGEVTEGLRLAIGVALAVLPVDEVPAEARAEATRFTEKLERSLLLYGRHHEAGTLDGLSWQEREVIIEALGIEEPPMPQWAVPGTLVFQENRGQRGIWSMIERADARYVYGDFLGQLPAGIVARLPHRTPSEVTQALALTHDEARRIELAHKPWLAKVDDAERAG